MEIRFSNVIPAPIPEKDILQSEIWKQELTFASGDRTLIYADSGKGKTTFVNIIFGSRKDYTGDVYLDGKNLRNFKISGFANLHKSVFSIVPQGLSLFHDLTLMENIEIKNRLQNYQNPARIAEMLEILGLSGFGKRKAGRLSFGQRQRVAIVRALCQSFEYILLDEAFSHLDATNTKIAWDLIKEEADKQNAGIILTSLNQEFDINLKKLRV